MLRKVKAASVAASFVVVGCGLTIEGVATPGREDAGEVDASAGGDAAFDRGVPPEDASPEGPTDAGADAMRSPPVFGEDCVAGTVYEDDFSFDPAGRWQTAAAAWSWDRTTKTFTVTGFNPHGVTWIGARPKWKDYVLEASLRVSLPSGTSTGNAGAFFRIRDVGPENNDGHMYLAGVVLGDSTQDVLFGIENGGVWSQQTQTLGGAIPNNAFFPMRVEVSGSRVKITANDIARIETTNGMYATGSIGFKTYLLSLSIRSVKVTCM